MRSLFLLPALAAAAPLAAQNAPAEADHVVDAIAACQAVTEADRVNPESLPAAGWDMAKRRGGRSERVIRGVYEKGENNALIVIGTEQERANTCVVQAFLADTSAYGSLLQQVSASIGMPERQDGFSYFWTIAGKAVRVDPAGDAKRPFARFEISAFPQESAE